jgi:predicted transcriptional regulator
MSDTRSLGNAASGRKKVRTDVIPISLWIVKALRDARRAMTTSAIADEVQAAKPTVRIWCVRLETLGLVKRVSKNQIGGLVDYWSWVSNP